MNLSDKDEKLVERMQEVQLLENGLEDIEIFEKALEVFRLEMNAGIIPYLCAVMNDDAVIASPVEDVLKTILDIVQNNEAGIDTGIMKVMEGTKCMLSAGHDWAMMLHMQFIIDVTLLDHYIAVFQKLDESEQIIILELLENLAEEEFFEEPDLSEIIRGLRKNE